jgi:hypothetical protein
MDADLALKPCDDLAELPVAAERAHARGAVEARSCASARPDGWRRGSTCIRRRCCRRSRPRRGGGECREGRRRGRARRQVGRESRAAQEHGGAHAESSPHHRVPAGNAVPKLPSPARIIWSAPGMLPWE